MSDAAMLGGPWTSHGHDIPGVTVAGEGRPGMYRCGGPRICRVCRREAAEHGLRGAGGDSEPAPERGDPPWSPEVLDIAAGIENVAMDVEDPRMSGALVGLAARVRALDTAGGAPGGAS